MDFNDCFVLNGTSLTRPGIIIVGRMSDKQKMSKTLENEESQKGG